MNIGDNLLWQQLAPPAPANPFVPFDQIDPVAVIADFRKRLADVEKAIVLAVPGDRIMSMIQVSPEAILIQSDRIGLLGETTFADYVRDLNGQATGVIDPAITLIRGDKIRTGSVANLNGTSYVNLNAVTTGQTFIQCASALSIMADGQFTFGSSTGKKLIWDGVDLTLGNSSLLGSTAVSTVVSNAASGATAYSSLSSKLNNSASDILSGNVQIQTTGGLRVGTIAWDSSGNLTSGSGIAITAKGMIGASSGTPTFTIETNGNATFKGSLTGANISGATGTFSGDISTSGNVTATGNTSYGGLGASIVAIPSAANVFGVYAKASGGSANAILAEGSGNAVAITGYNTDGSAPSIVGTISSSSHAGVYAENGGSGPALQLNGKMVTNDNTKVTNLNAEYASGIYFGSTTTGAATATFPGNNKPGSNSSCVWAPVVNTSGSTIGYMPFWT